jgi:hypothetical protein
VNLKNGLSGELKKKAEFENDLFVNGRWVSYMGIREAGFALG